MKLLVVTGPTATGKTHLGVALARLFNGEIVGADSRQVYRGMDLGTGKDLAEFGDVPHHLIDIVDPRHEYNLHSFLRDAAGALADIASRRRLPVVVGGSPLYVQALLENYELPGGAPDPAFRAGLADLSTDELLARLLAEAPGLYARTDKTQRQRVIRALEIAHCAPSDGGVSPLPELDALVLAPYYPRKTVHERIRLRLEQRLQAGLLEEVQRLHDNGLSWERLEFFGLEYRDAARHLQGNLDADAFFTALFTHIRRFCKAQDVWFRKMERQGTVIHWLPEGDPGEAEKLVALFLRDDPLPPPRIRISEIHYGPTSNPK